MLHTGRTFRAILLAGAATIGFAATAQATDIVLSSGSSSQQALNQGDSLTVNAGVSLTTSGSTVPVLWNINGGTNGALTIINNSGTINAGGSGQGVDTNAANSGGNRNFTFNNLTAASQLISTKDALRINTDIGGGTATADNFGTIQGAQAIDFSAITSATAHISITNESTGAVNGAGDDAIHGASGGIETIVNYGSILGATGKRGVDTSATTSLASFTLTNGDAGHAGASIQAGDDAVRISGSMGSGTATINNSGTIQSATGQALDFNTIGTAATVNINNSGTIQSTGNDAVALSGNIVTVVNRGSILGTASTRRALDLAPTTISSTLVYSLTNGSASNSGALIQSDDDAVRIGSSTSTLSTTATYVVAVDNFGTIRSAIGQAIDFDKANSTAGRITITNEATGIIKGDNADTIRPGANATVNNYGQITSSFVASVATPTGNASDNDAIDFQSNAGGVVNNFAGGAITGAKNGVTAKYAPSITNAGTITGLDGSGINIDTSRDATPANPDITATGIVTVVNTGTIIGTAKTADGDAIDVDYLTNVTNSGTIKAVGIVDPSVGSLNEALAIGGGSVVNNVGGLIVSDQRAITVDDSNKGNAFGAISIDNYGTITGSDSASGGIGGISITSNVSNILTNRATGVINGGVLMGSGNDTVNLYAGEVLNGTLDGGAGTDTINLLGSGNGTLASAVNFEALAVQGGSWALSGNQSFTSVSVSNGAALKIGGAATTSTLTVNGNLVLASGATTQVTVTPSAASLINVSGTATLGGTFVANLASGTYAPGQQFTVLTATGGFNGTFATTASGAISYLRPRLSYDATHVYLSLDQVTLASLAGSGVNTNQAQVLAALDKAVANGTIPSGGFLALYGLSGTALQAALDQVSGQAAPNVGGAVGQSFLSFMAMTGAGGGGDTGGGFAPGSAYADADAPHRAQLSAGTARLWGGAYGGHVGLSGNAVSGAAGLSSNNVGFVGGADFETGNGLLAGVTLSVGRQTFRSGNATGNSNDQMIGVYARDSFGAVYVSAALGYGWHQIKTLRLVTVSGADLLQGKQNADDYGGRIEAGWRMALDDGGASLSPYAALTAERFRSPAYAEGAISGASTFALSNGAHTSDTARSELGLRFGDSFDRDDAQLRAELHAAWAHQYDGQPLTQASFLGLGSTSFQVAGVRVAADSALIGAGLEMEGRNGLYAAVRGETQLGAGTTVLEGMGNLGWRW
jgi:uncharacterized protein with beta-barrel porin domain